MRLIKISQIILVLGFLISKTYAQSGLFCATDPVKKQEKVFVNYQKAQDFMRAEKYRKAARYFDKAYSDCIFECDTILIKRSYALSTYGNYKLAKKVLDQAYILNPKRDELLLAYGWMNLTEKNGLISIGYYDRYLIKHPNDNLAIYRRGQAYDKINNDSMAMVNYYHVYKNLKNDTNFLAKWVLQKIGKKAYSQKKYRYAINAYSRLYAIQKNRIEDQFLMELGYSYMNILEFDSAANCFSDLALNPKPRTIKEYHEFCLIINECTRLQGDNFHSLDGYNIILVESRKKEIRGKAYLGRAKVYYDWGEYGSALGDLKNSNKLIDPTWDYYYYLALVYDKIGRDKTEVCEILDLAFEMGIEDPSAVQNAKMLKEKYCRDKSFDPY